MEVMRSMEGFVLDFERERSFLKNILMKEVRRLTGEKCCCEGGSRLFSIILNSRCEVG